MSYKEFMRGIYVSPEAIALSPEYAKVLVEQEGVNTFIMRTGFDAGYESPSLEKALEVIRKLEAKVYFLVGTWWGIGVTPEKGCMKELMDLNINQMVPAHESQWHMLCPGGEADDLIKLALDKYVRQYQPDGVCLTHARFRHPAHIPGLFEYGSGKFEQHVQDAGISFEKLRLDLNKVDSALQKIDVSALKKASEIGNLDDFLDYLTESDTFERWFEARCKAITYSVSNFAKTVKEISKDTLFGVNAFSPIGNRLCGQDYIQLSKLCDFIQPLLGYVRWHVLQPVGAWAEFLLRRVNNLSEEDAIGIAAKLFKLDGIILPNSMKYYYQHNEGEEKSIQSIVIRQMDLCRKLDLDTMMLPVLRGHEWSESTLLRLRNEIKPDNFDGEIFQGTTLLTGQESREGWE